MHVAELVPQVAAVNAARRPAPQRRGPATAASRSRCEARGSWNPVSRPSTTRTPRSGSRPGRSSSPVATPSAAGLQRPHDRRADGDDPAAVGLGVRATAPAVAAGSGTTPGTAARAPPPTRHPVCSSSGATCTPAVASRVTSRSVNGRPALGISALPGWVGEHRLVGGQRPRPAHVAVPDRLAVPVQVRRNVRGGHRGHPQPARRVRRVGRDGGPAAQREPLAAAPSGWTAPPAGRRCAARPASARVPSARRRRRRTGFAVDKCTAGPSAVARHRGRQGGGRVDHDQVAGAQHAGQVAEHEVRHAVVADRRRAGVRRRGQSRVPRVVGRCATRASGRAKATVAAHHARDRASGRARSRPPAGAVEQPQEAGTTVSGSGRSQMSSPGKASWCMAVRMSPGSNAYTRRSGSSAASTLRRAGRGRPWRRRSRPSRGRPRRRRRR